MAVNMRDGNPSQPTPLDSACALQKEPGMADFDCRHSQRNVQAITTAMALGPEPASACVETPGEAAE
jgi:hypothetical protein